MLKACVDGEMKDRKSVKIISESDVSDAVSRLNSHPLYSSLRELGDLRLFMEHHVFSVWDFMSLAKSLQEIVAPVRQPWMPGEDGSLRRFINELILEEECDEGPSKGEYRSHFEIYMDSMSEVGADVEPCRRFLRSVVKEGLDRALELPCVPNPSKAFTRATFDIIRSKEPHKIAAAFALGRESIIPDMFREILSKAEVPEESVPTFHYYLNRHVELDEGQHGPMAMRLLNSLCGGEECKVREAIHAAEQAIEARIRFWDGILASIESDVFVGTR